MLATDSANDAVLYPGTVEILVFADLTGTDFNFHAQSRQRTILRTCRTGRNAVSYPALSLWSDLHFRFNCLPFG
ncbi:hypothetical protein RESH_01317 [Rhodopirellula europaea SH398]|uniref:Uncharacterized protein n=1 Tax=Rhodopirellula europaea SH398 TaxID=1263868 RepID=M5S9D3_9BACT|nr:hypothetical protein RESH_01317 [Rhodopirellula europaea SH398]